jgi:hypothetical protein
MFVDTFLSYVISKVTNAISKWSWHRHSCVPALSRRPHAVHAQPRRTVARCGLERGLGGSARLKDVLRA